MSVLDGDIFDTHASTTNLKPIDDIYHSALRFMSGAAHQCALYSSVRWSSLALGPCWKTSHLKLFITCSPHEYL